jgi:O-succinylhomoserine sulfhydrylase
MNYPESENFETKAIRIQNEKTQNREHSVPIYMTSSFTFEDAEQARALFADEIPGNIYTRFSNPNNSEFVQKVCALEGAEDGIATASGMSAVYTEFHQTYQSQLYSDIELLLLYQVYLVETTKAKSHQILKQNHL